MAKRLEIELSDSKNWFKIFDEKEDLTYLTPLPDKVEVALSFIGGGVTGTFLIDQLKIIDNRKGVKDGE